MDVSTPVVVLAPGFVGHGIARSLGRLGVAVYGVHADARSPAMRSRYWRANLVRRLDAAPAAESVEWLLALARGIGGQPILVPTDDTSCLFVSDHDAALREEYTLPTQPPGLARSLSNKAEMFRLCREHGVPTPETLFPRSRGDVLAFVETAVFPVMLKPILARPGAGSAGMRIVLARSPAELLAAYDRMETPNAPNLMLQEYIPCGPDRVWMFNGYFDEESTCLLGMTGQKLRQYPAYTGVTSLGICMRNDVVARRTREFMRAVGYRGILDIGYKFDARLGEYRLLDVNPRIGSTFRLFVDSAQMDVARALYLDLTGQHVPVGLPREGRKWIVEDFDCVSSARYMRDGRLGVLEWLLSFRGVEEGSWFALDDLAPFRAAMWRSARVPAGRLTALLPTRRAHVAAAGAR